MYKTEDLKRSQVVPFCVPKGFMEKVILGPSKVGTGKKRAF
jgi:hypothetical protein